MNLGELCPTSINDIEAWTPPDPEPSTRHVLGSNVLALLIAGESLVTWFDVTISPLLITATCVLWLYAEVMERPNRPRIYRCYEVKPEPTKIPPKKNVR